MTRTRRQHTYKKQNGSPTILKKGHAHKSKKDYDRKAFNRKRYMEEMHSGYYHDEGDWGSPRDHRPLDFSDGFIYDETKLFNQDLG